MMLFKPDAVATAPTARRHAPQEAGIWVIEPRPTALLPRFRELWEFRRLLWYFGDRALRKIYARTTLGWTWVLLRPIFPLATGALIFGDFIGVGSGTVPYFLFFLVGAIVWNLFSSALTWVTRSLELNRKLLHKLYFPRLILPFATLTPALVETAIYSVIGLIAVLYYWVTSSQTHILWSPRLITAPLIILGPLVFALGLGLWTSVYGASARDVRFTVGYVLGFWFYLTPVIYPVSFVPPRWAWILWLNPMAAYLETFRWAVLGLGAVPALRLIVALAISLAALAAGLNFFVRAEAESIDRL